MAYLSRDKLLEMGFAAVGENVLVSEHATLYGTERIRLGDHVRIDDFCVLSAGAGGIEIGNHVHVAVFCSLIGAGKIMLSDFSNLSSRVAIYSSNDDYSGNAMTNPTVPPEFTNVQHGDVFLGRHVIVGSGSVILPGAVLEEGVAVGALSLVKGRCEAFGIYAGYPVKRIKSRSRRLLEIEKEFMNWKETGK